MADIKSDRRYKIVMGIRPGRQLPNGKWVWDTAVWPILFDTAKEAQAHADTCDAFRGVTKYAKPRMTWLGGRRVASISIKAVRVPIRAAPEDR